MSKTKPSCDVQPSMASLEYAFNYFDLHAKQRMTVFNFYLVLSGALSGGIGASLQGEKIYPLSGLLLSLLLMLLSLVFYKLDLRTSFLIKHAERALAANETEALHPSAHLVGSEEADFNSWQGERPLLRKAWSYSQCFKAVFAATTMVGVFGFFYSLKLLNLIPTCI